MNTTPTSDDDPIFRYRTARQVPSTSGPAHAAGMVEQTSPAPHRDDIIAAAAALTDVSPPSADKAAKDAEVLGVPYQVAGQVRQLLAQRANALAYLNLDLVASIDVNLAAIGYCGDLTADPDDDLGPLGRKSRSDKTVTTDSPTKSESGTGGTTAPAKADTPDSPKSDNGKSDTGTTAPAKADTPSKKA
jgi:hypothetical protein